MTHPNIQYFVLVVAPQQQKSTLKASTQNLTSLLASPIKNRSNRSSASDPIDNQDCYVISNNSISEPSPEFDLSNGSPTISYCFVERSFSDGRDRGPPLSLRNAQSSETVTNSKQKRKQGGNRHKSCEIEYQPNGNISDVERSLSLTPLIHRRRSLREKRQKSNTNLKELIQTTDNGMFSVNS